MRRPARSPSSSAATYDTGAGFDSTPGAAEEGFYDDQAALEDRKIVRHSRLDLETMEFDTALTEISRMVAEAGGYVQSQSVDGQSMYYSGKYYERSASIQARIPADKLDQVTSQVGDLCNLVSQSENMDDITDTYYDTEARLSSLKLQEERLLAILAQAEKLEDIITLESALSEVRYEIETLTASINRMDGQVAYSYLNISLREVVEYNIQKSQPKTFGERLGASFGRSWENLSTALEGLLFFVIEQGPVLIIYALFIFVIVLLVRAILRAWRKRHPQGPPPPMAGGGPGPGPVPGPAPRWTPGEFQKHPPRPQSPEGAAGEPGTRPEKPPEKK